MSNERQSILPESQSARRLKYGAVVGVTIVIAILLATGVIIAAERKPKRIDTTAVGLYSLKPQTINIIKNNDQPIRITSLYTKAKSSEEQQAAAKQGGQVAAVQLEDVADQADKVADLLEEYHTKGKKIEVDSIDPITNPTKRNELIAEVKEKYGGQVNKYEDFVGKTDTAGSYAKAFKDLQAQLDAESAAVKALPFAQVKSEDLVDVFGQVYSSLKELTSNIKETPEEIKRDLRDNPPELKKGADQVKEVADGISEQMAQIIDFLTKLKGSNAAKALPEPVVKYVTESLPRYTKIKTQAEALSKEAAGLGELKLDTLGEALRQKNSILIRSDNDWKVIPYDQVWRRDLVQTAGSESKSAPRFAGEQMITAAIWSLEHPQKLKVVFVRAGGQPVTQPGFPPLIPGGLYADVAERLREYNYDVSDKDLTGMSQMQQQQMAAPEPSEAEIRDAVWVVVDWPQSQNPQQPTPTIASKVADHLNQGGSALFLVAAPDMRSADDPNRGGAKADDMKLALKDWGIELDVDRIIVHSAIKVEGGAQGTELDKAMRLPFIFQIQNWGDSPVTAPLQSLPGVVISPIPVKRTDVPGVKSWSILPTPDDQKYWAESNISSVSGEPTFSKAEGDLEGPLYMGAVAEKAKAGRVVAIGCWEMPMNSVMRYRDSEGQIRAAPFPGNSEIFMDSIFWLSHQEPMIAISPAAMDVSRLAPMSRATQNFWRAGVLLALLPALAIVMGAMVFIARKD